jgi:hypothetical protein
LPYYIFNFKKGKTSLEFESTDRNFVSYQLDKWIEEIAGITIAESPAPSRPVQAEKVPLKPATKVIREEDIEVITDDTPAPPIKESVEDLEEQVESAIKATQNIIKDVKEIEQTVKEPTFESLEEKTPEITGIVGEIFNINDDDEEEIPESVIKAQETVIKSQEIAIKIP